MAERNGGFVTGLLLGLLAGASLAMVSAPASGEDVRDKARDAAAGTSALLERGREIVEGARARVDGAVAEGRDAAEQQRNELQSRT